jgi:hypothetical protein
VLVLAVVFIYFLVPETKSRTYLENDELWRRRISPRHFAKTELITLPTADEKVVD